MPSIGALAIVTRLPDQGEGIIDHPHRIDHLNDGQVLYIAIDPDGEWARSEFPRPLITVDYNADDEVIGISPAGPAVAETLETYKSWLSRGAQDAQDLVNDLGDTKTLASA